MLMKMIVVNCTFEYKFINKECPKILLRSIIKIMNNNLNGIPEKKISDSFMYCSKRDYSR